MNFYKIYHQHETQLWEIENTGCPNIIVPFFYYLQNVMLELDGIIRMKSVKCRFQICSKNRLRNLAKGPSS